MIAECFRKLKLKKPVFSHGRYSTEEILPKLVIPCCKNTELQNKKQKLNVWTEPKGLLQFGQL